MRNNAVIKAGVLVEHRGRLLLIKERRRYDGAYRWNIVKGTFDPARDATVLDTAVREAREEAHARVRLQGLLDVVCLTTRGKHLVQFNFTATLADRKRGARTIAPGGAKYARGSGEHIRDARFFTKEELRALPRRALMGERTRLALRRWLRHEPLPRGAFAIAKNL